jgi:hypothetical protein
MRAKTFIRLGYWKSEQEPKLPVPKPNTSKLTQAEELVIVEYLDSGTVHNRYKGFSMCRICKTHNGSIDRTDGEYCWPSGLSHYVAEHHVALPVEFTEKVLKGGWR